LCAAAKSSRLSRRLHGTMVRPWKMGPDPKKIKDTVVMAVHG